MQAKKRSHHTDAVEPPSKKHKGLMHAYIWQPAQLKDLTDKFTQIFYENSSSVAFSVIESQACKAFLEVQCFVIISPGVYATFRLSQTCGVMQSVGMNAISRKYVAGEGLNKAYKKSRAAQTQMIKDEKVGTSH